MKYIGILSDTHGYLDPAVFDYFQHCDEIWHAGDFGAGVVEPLLNFKPLKGVYGNIDDAEVRSSFPETLSFICEEVKVLMTHIGGYPKHYEPRMVPLLRSFEPHLFITGHSHILKIIRDPQMNNLLHINPGAAGRSGFQIMRTAVRLKIEGKRIYDAEVIELGKKGVNVK